MPTKSKRVEAPYYITVNGEKVIGGKFKYDKMWFAMFHDEDGFEFTGGWGILGCGFTPEELVASVADTCATGEALPEASLLEFLATFKAWLASDKSHLPFSSPERYQFRHYLWHEEPDEAQVPMLNIVVQRMPDYGT